jgi:hypothetical protein
MVIHDAATFPGIVLTCPARKPENKFQTCSYVPYEPEETSIQDPPSQGSLNQSSEKTLGKMNEERTGQHETNEVGKI